MKSSQSGVQVFSSTHFVVARVVMVVVVGKVVVEVVVGTVVVIVVAGTVVVAVVVSIVVAGTVVVVVVSVSSEVSPSSSVALPQMTLRPFHSSDSYSLHVPEI